MSFTAAQFSHVASAGGGGDASQATLLRVVDLLEADQRIEDGQLVFYKRGTTTPLMPPKAVSGSTCSDNVGVVQT